MKKIILLTLLIMLGACTDLLPAPTLAELDWNPPKISVSNCPDLSGSYVLDSPRRDDYRWLFLGEYKALYDSHEMYMRDKDLNVYISVESRPDGIYVKADNGRRSVDSFTRYNGTTIGCSSGMVVSRFIGPLNRPAESGNCTNISYGESRVYLSDNKDINVVYSQRDRCGDWGSLANKSPSESYNSAPYVFRRIDHPAPK